MFRVLGFVMVPEPSCALLLLAGTAVLIFRRGR